MKISKPINPRGDRLATERPQEAKSDLEKVLDFRRAMTKAEALERVLAALEGIEGIDVLPAPVLQNVATLALSLITDAVVADRDLLRKTVETATLYLPTLGGVPDPRPAISQGTPPTYVSCGTPDPVEKEAELGDGEGSAPAPRD